MKPLVIYHANCTDGFGAAFAAWMRFGDDAEYKPMNYGDKDFSHPFDIRENVLDRDVYVLDFSFPREIMEQIMVDAARVVWLDHHKTAFEMWCGAIPDGGQWAQQTERGDFTLLDNHRSGAYLAWQYFHPDTEVPIFIQHIDDRDRWVFALKGSKELHAALQSHQPWSFQQWEDTFYDPDTDSWPGLDDLYDQGRALLRAQDIMVEQQSKQAMRCCLQGQYWGLALNTQNHVSETGHVLANKSGTYGLLWYVAADGKVKCSLRSNGDYDVSAIAKTFGGGGHRNAAGFETDINTLMGWLE